MDNMYYEQQQQQQSIEIIYSINVEWSFDYRVIRDQKPIHFPNIHCKAFKVIKCSLYI